MKKETADSGKMYFEDLPENIQEILLDLIVSGLKNMKSKEAGLVPGSDPGSNSRKRKASPKRNRVLSR